MLPTVHYNMGGIPTDVHGRVLTLRDGDPETIVPGLMAVGEAGCVSVHGANRLGSNSLLDLVVFGRAAARHCRDSMTPGERQAPLGNGAGADSVERLDRLRHASGNEATADVRLEMQKTMQNNAAVFRTGEILAEGIDKLAAVQQRFADIAVSDRSLVWNTDLIETMELENLLLNAAATGPLGGQSQGESRRAGA